MKRMIKALLKPFWRLSSPLRRPLIRRFDDRLSLLVSGTVNARVLPELIEPLTVVIQRLERIEDSLAHADRTAMALSEEVDLVLNGVSREIFRLQAQLEHLQTTLARDARMASGGFSIVDQSGEQGPILRGALNERSKVG